MYATKTFNEKEQEKLIEFKGTILAIESELLENMKSSRELSMVITKLDEAMLWYGAALAFDGISATK